MTRLRIILCTALIAGAAGLASAMPVQVQSANLPAQCDPLPQLPVIMDELGTSAAFPLDEFITAASTFSMIDACNTSSSPNIVNSVLSITNQTNILFTDLYYVSDPGTGFTNFDGTINTFEAVRIDNVGVNRPLIAESGGVQPLVFEPGETWTFILDDWNNGGGLTPADLGSIGIPSFGLPDPSSGSIVAIPVPEPAGAALVLLGMCATGALRRR